MPTEPEPDLSDRPFAGGDHSLAYFVTCCESLVREAKRRLADKEAFVPAYNWCRAALTAILDESVVLLPASPAFSTVEANLAVDARDAAHEGIMAAISDAAQAHGFPEVACKILESRLSILQDRLAAVQPRADGMTRPILSWELLESVFESAVIAAKKAAVLDLAGKDDGLNTCRAALEYLRAGGMFYTLPKGAVKAHRKSGAA